MKNTMMMTFYFAKRVAIWSVEMILQISLSLSLSLSLSDDHHTASAYLDERLRVGDHAGAIDHVGARTLELGIPEERDERGEVGKREETRDRRERGRERRDRREEREM